MNEILSQFMYYIVYSHIVRNTDKEMNSFMRRFQYTKRWPKNIHKI